MTHTTTSTQEPSGDEADGGSRDDLMVQHGLDVDKIDNLEKALTSSRTIGAAIGIIMERRKVRQQEAFDILAEISQRNSRKLREVAEHIVDTGEIPSP